MDSQRWHRLKRIYYAVQDCDPESRQKIIDKTCANDAVLRHDVHELLEAGVDESFMNSPFSGAMSELFQQEGAYCRFR